MRRCLWYNIIKYYCAENRLPHLQSGRTATNDGAQGEKMAKIKVLFPFIEAGFGHIMTEKSICDSFEKKYGDRVEVIRNDFYKNSGRAMANYEKMFTKSVKDFNKNVRYGYTVTNALKFFGGPVVADFLMKVMSPIAYKKSMEKLANIAPDVVVSTHWATVYYAAHMPTKPLNVLYIPDVHAYELFCLPCDFAMVYTQKGYEEGLADNPAYNPDNFKLVPFAIRNEAYEVSRDKHEVRKQLGLKDKFTIYMVEGAYGIGMMADLCKAIIDLDWEVNLVAVCGKNPKLEAKLGALKSKGHTDLHVFGYLKNPLPYIAAADLYMGKSGNGLAEAAFYNVPIVVTHSANDIEQRIASRYVDELKIATRKFKLDEALDFVKQAMNGEGEYKQLAAVKVDPNLFGSEKIADEIYAQIVKRFGEQPICDKADNSENN